MFPTICEFVVLKQEITYSVLFPAPVVSTVFSTKPSEESRERFQNCERCVESYPDTVVLFSDWLLSPLYFFDWLVSGRLDSGLPRQQDMRLRNPAGSIARAVLLQINLIMFTGILLGR